MIVYLHVERKPVEQCYALTKNGERCRFGNSYHCPRCGDRYCGHHVEYAVGGICPRCLREPK